MLTRMRTGSLQEAEHSMHGNLLRPETVLGGQNFECTSLPGTKNLKKESAPEDRTSTIALCRKKTATLRESTIYTCRTGTQTGNARQKKKGIAFGTSRGYFGWIRPSGRLPVADSRCPDQQVHTTNMGTPVSNTTTRIGKRLLNYELKAYFSLIRIADSARLRLISSAQTPLRMIFAKDTRT